MCAITSDANYKKKEKLSAYITALAAWMYLRGMRQFLRNYEYWIYEFYFDILYHPVRVVPVLKIAAKLVATLAQIYDVAAVYMYAICSQLFLGIYKEISFQSI